MGEVGRLGSCYRELQVTLSLLASLAGTPVAAADVETGGQLAQRWCSACHVVAPDQHGPATEARPFASIARAPDRDAPGIAMFLLQPHPKMPDMSLTPKEATDLAAYIMSLK